METTSTFNISSVGESSGRPYQGKFTVKAVLTRREIFAADERRRFILGANPQAAPPSLQGEAYILGQLFVRIQSGPEWWSASDFGLDIDDANIIGEIYRLTEEKVEEKQNELKESAKSALEQLANKPQRKTAAAQQE